MAITKKCKACGKEFEPGSNRATYCSKECKYGTGICKTCGKEFVKKKKTTGDYCSTRCWYNSGDIKVTEYKRCSACELEKPIDQFPYAGGKGELSSWCRDCHSNKYTEKTNVVRQNRVELAVYDFPKRINSTRIEMGLTQNEFGKLFGVGTIQVRLWEKGKSLPHPKRARQIFEHLGWEIPFALTEMADNRIPLGVKICPNCGNEFPIYSAKTKFCSRICNNKYHSGERNSSWRNGRMPTGGGYIKVKSPDHSNADSRGYVLEHVIVMSNRIGRPLAPHESVHHKNGIRDDNRDENLELWATRKDPPGQRIEDLVAFVVKYYQKEIEVALSIQHAEKVDNN